MMNLRITKELIIVTVTTAGLVAALLLVGYRQIFNPHASTQPVEILDQAGNPLLEENNVPVTNSTSIQLHLTPPEAQ